MSNILELIKDYQETVKLGVEAMQKEFNTRKLLRGWRTKDIPKEGILSTGAEYDFHGIGCFIIINNITVNFDFGPEDRFDGFDLWRLSTFVDEKPEVYQFFLENDGLLEIQFQKLVNDGVIVKPNWEYSDLYYLSEQLK